jgi:hypothetical protein
MDWHFSFHWGRQKQPDSSYHLLRGDSAMGKWAEKFSAKFTADLNEARIGTERAVQKQRAIESKQAAFGLNSKK